MTSYLQRSRMLLTISLVATLVMNLVGPQIFAGSVPGFDAKEIKKLAKSFSKAVRGQESDNAINIVRQISIYGTEDAMEALYDMGYKEATIPSVYTVICEELSRIDGILEYLTERYDKIDSKSDFRERVYLSDILAFPTKKRGELNDEILKIGRRIAEIEEDGLPPGADPSIPDRLKQQRDKLKTQLDRLRGNQNDDFLMLLSTMLDDKSAFVQGAAVEALRTSQSAIGVEPLITLLQKLVKIQTQMLRAIGFKILVTRALVQLFGPPNVAIAKMMQANGYLDQALIETA